jgi:hypothetical protein
VAVIAAHEIRSKEGLEMDEDKISAFTGARSLNLIPELLEIQMQILECLDLDLDHLVT